MSYALANDEDLAALCSEIKKNSGYEGMVLIWLHIIIEMHTASTYAVDLHKKGSSKE